MTKSLVYLCGESTPIDLYDVKFGHSPKTENAPVDVSDLDVILDQLDLRDDDNKTLVSIIALAVMPDGRVFYHYHATRDLTFSFDLRSEVGEPWQADFERIVTDNNLQIVTREIDERPWVYDAIAGSEAAQRGREL